MQITVYEALVPATSKILGNLSAILDKAEAFAKAKEIEPSVLLNARLAPNMFALTRQVQIACDIAKGGAARLSGTEVPKFEDTEASFDEIKARIAKTVAFIKSIPAAKFTGAEDRDITLASQRGDRHFKGLDYLRDFVLPNVYFHVTTTYAILRHNGVEIGKNDFLGS
jgi:uncharacterized protein